MPDDIAIKVEGLSKTFRIPHEKHTSLKSTAINLFKKKGYTEFKALDDINFEIKKGEFFGIIGRNGCGKSTLLKILAGIYTADKGNIEINGKLSPFLELGVGFNPELTGSENIFLGGSILGLTREQVEKKYNKIVEFSELGEFIDMKLKNYSSGMQVRLAFSLSIHVNAEILLMDEVLAVGDTNFQSKCIEEFNSYRDQGKTVVLVTHDINTIQRYCDRAILLRKGKIEEIGAAPEVADLYTNQNMEDEEKRNIIIDPIKNRADEKRKAVIEDVKVFDKNDTEKRTYISGEKIKILINYKIYDKNLKDINFAVGIRTGEGTMVFACTTEFIDTVYLKSKKSITLTIDSMNILKGEYYINILIFGKNPANQIDFKPKIKKIIIYNTGDRSKLLGLVYNDYDWS